MAAKLQCEICGGKLVGMPGGVFECEACGTEYSTAWAKEKIQEITGTVKVEGTVEVTGKVQIDGPVKVEGGVNKEALLQRGRLALEDGDWDKAEGFFDQVLTIDAEYADAWLGLVMVNLELNREDDFSLVNTGSKSVYKNTNYKKFIRFASEERKKQIEDKIALAEKKKQEVLLQAQDAELSFRKTLPALRAKIAPAKDMIIATSFQTFGLKSDGTVLVAGAKGGVEEVLTWNGIKALSVLQYGRGCFVAGLSADGKVRSAGESFGDRGLVNVSSWKDIVKIEVGSDHIVGLKSDGTVVAAGNNRDGQCEVSCWTDVVAISASWHHTVGLRKDGSVLATGENKDGQCNVDEWRDVIKIKTSDHHTVGLKSNGTVLAVGDNEYDQCDLEEWKDIIDIYLDSTSTFGLRSDGTVVASYCLEDASDHLMPWRRVVDMYVCNDTPGVYPLLADGTIPYEEEFDEYDVSGWIDIIAVSGGEGHLVGLKSDGTVVAIGDNRDGQCNVRGWKLFDSIEMLHNAND